VAAETEPLRNSNHPASSTRRTAQVLTLIEPLLCLRPNPAWHVGTPTILRHASGQVRLGSSRRADCSLAFLGGTL
jgi:hypothetical protein